MMKADRLQHIKEYYFSTKLKEVNELRLSGKPIINMGIGSPDLPPHPSVIQKLTITAQEKTAHSYQSYRGIPALRQAISSFYQNKFEVDLNPDTEILPLIGSKEGIMHISMAFLNPGDAVLLPDPGYMTYTSATLLAGGKPVFYELTEQNNYLPDLARLEKQDLSKVKLMWINYPHMPTGTLAGKQDFEQILDFARRNDILLVNDNPYSFILNPNPVSLLQIPKAKEVAIELNSLSKSHNMAGWRLGWMAGNEAHINTVMQFKSQMDSGMFYPLQQAAVTALQLGDDWYKNLNEIYSRRKILVLKIAEKLGLKTRRNQVGMFVWAKLPKGKKSKDFTDALLYEKNIFVAPGFIFGKNSDNYVRFSLTLPVDILKEVINRL